MKQHRAWLYILLALLVVVGIPTGLLVREFRHEQVSLDLIAAIKRDDIPAALTALKSGADPNVRDHADDKSLSFAQHMKQLLHKLRHPNATPEPDDHWTALLLHLDVSKEDNITLVEALLKAGANPNGIGGPHAVTPIMRAAMGKRSKTLRLLRQYGADLQQKDKERWTSLYYAVVCDNAEDISLLVAAGNDVNAKTREGETLLCYACSSGSPETVWALLQCQADPNLRDGNGDTPLDVAKNNINAPVMALLRKVGAKTSEELSAHSAVANKGNNSKR